MKIQSGRIVRTNEDTKDWQLNHRQSDDGQTDRSHRERVAFEQPFVGTPTVQVSLAHLDIIASRTERNGVERPLNTRIGVDSQNIDRSGFDLVFETWADSLIAGIGVVWFAYGE